MADRKAVTEFLAEFNAAVSLGFFTMVPREKNTQGLIDLGLTPNGVKELTAALTPDNYCRGPEADRDGSGQDVWIFGMEVAGAEAYIKLKLVPDPRKRHVSWAKVLAFHVAERALTYPLREARI